MNAKVYNFTSGDWVTTIGDGNKPLLNQVFKTSPNFSYASDGKEPNEDGFESVYVRKKVPKETSAGKQNKQKKKKQAKRKRALTPPHPFPNMMKTVGGDWERTYFMPYTSSCFQYNNLYRSNVMPKYLNGTIASEMKRVGKEYWPSRYYEQTPPFVASCNTKNTHNLVLLKQETFAKMKAAILPFKSQELNDQTINSLRSIKRSIEKYWKL